jgi:hypothetical protein
MRPVLLLAVLVAAFTTAPASAAQRTVPQGFLGVTVDGPMTPASDDEWDRMVAAGVETVRVAMRWNLIQPYSIRDGDFSSTDALVEAAARRHLAVLPVVESTPGWARKYPFHAAPPGDLKAVRRFFGALVRRYGPEGTFWVERPDLPRVPIRAWQIFNEPNLRGFWSSQPFAKSYVPVLRVAERALHAADPGATVVLAGLANRSWHDLRSIYRAGGRGHFDAVALHPYTARPADVLRLVRRARRVMRQHGDNRLPIWITEFTWTARGKVSEPFDLDTTDSGQASRLANVLRRFVAAQRSARIARVFWYTWLSDEAVDGAFNWSGLRRLRGGTPFDTPALQRFREAAQLLEGCVKAPGDASRCAP